MATMTQSETPAGRTGAAAAPIALEGVSHDYGTKSGTRRALDGLSFAVGRAEIFGLLGPNGSGKTTLFRILSTLMTASGGTARIEGFDAGREPNRVRQQIGIVFQAHSLDGKLTVAENLKHQGHLYGLKGAELKARIGEVLERVGLADRAKDKAETLSGGQQRRVELAKGLIHAPQVLLLDEPSTGLDPGARRDLWLYLKTLREREGATVLVTTHLMEEAEHCDRLAILSEGKLVALGTPAELKAEIGGDVVTFETGSEATAGRLAQGIGERFGMAAQVFGNAVRVERDQGHRWVTEVVEAFPGMVEGVSVAKPSLEDVFLDRTGHRFWNEAEPEENAGKKPKRGRH